jgi:hypothetical protein
MQLTMRTRSWKVTGERLVAEAKKLCACFIIGLARCSIAQDLATK